MRTLVLIGHPNPDSYCHALAHHYAQAARQGGAEVHILDLARLNFDPSLHRGYRSIQPLEPDLQRAQELLTWCQHLLVVTPTWWSSMPAVLKGFIDRIFLPGFAFKYRPGHLIPEKLLRGRTARLIVTTDSPPLLLRTVMGDSTVRAIAQGVLGFSGFKVKSTRFGILRTSTPRQREAWLAQTARLAQRDHAHARARPPAFTPS